MVNETGPVLNEPKGYGFGWMTQILPYFEMKNVYNHFNLKVGLYEAPNLTTRTNLVRSFLCPSDNGPTRDTNRNRDEQLRGGASRRRGADRRRQPRGALPEQPRARTKT